MKEILQKLGCANMFEFIFFCIVILFFIATCIFSIINAVRGHAHKVLIRWFLDHTEFQSISYEDCAKRLNLSEVDFRMAFEEIYQEEEKYKDKLELVITKKE